MKIKRGDVVLVKFPFTNLSSTKRRPAVVVSSNRFNEKLSDVIFVPMTTTAHRGHDNGEVLILKDSESGKLAGIKMDSIIKCFGITSITKDFVYKVIGSLLPQDLKKVSNVLKIVLDL